MAPRKRASSSSTSSSTKKSNHNQQPSQPSKFGIQHFFERHSQSQAAAPSSSAAPRNPYPCPSPNPNPNPPEEDVISQISPEITKSVHLKRFKFSPGMLIKQSQDDGGEEVTWKFSPVNDRLRSFASKQLPGMTKLFSNDSRPGTSTLRPCSENQISSCSVGKLEKWLSSPTITASDKALTSSRMVSIEGTEIWNGIVSSNGLAESKSPFITPPSLPYAPNESISGVVSGDTISDQLDTRPHRKQLLDLLDQVEDAITEESVPDADGGKMRTKNDHIEESVVDTPKEETYCDDKTFLVLEVSEKHKSVTSSCTQNPYKVLRLLDERGGQERALHLCDEWFYSLIAPGDSINVIGEFDEEGKCVIDHNNNLIIIHPDILISGTRVASSFTCPRRAVLDERLKSTEHSTAALIGTLLHQVFQAGLVKDFPTRHFLEEYAGVVLHKNFENLYACGANENDIYSKLIEAIPKLLNWLRDFRKAEGQHQGSKTATVDFGHCEGKKALCISEVVDIEEMAWAPRYGLKGVIDASVHVKMSTSCGDSQETIMPLEFKTGKGTTGQSATEHYAQVILYTILMSERYLKKDIDSGLLYYLHTDQTRGIKVQRSDLVGLIMRRNELATDILKASTSQLLPPMLQSLTMCRGCRHLDSCTVYHKAHGGDSEASGLGELFDNHVNHLTTAHNHFLRHWDRLIDLEAKMSQVLKKEILHSHNIRERRSNSLSPVILDVSNGSSVHGSPKSGRFIYRFVRQKLLHPETEPHTLENMDPSESLPSCPDCILRCGDRVILSTESGRVAVGNGIICDINHLNVSISFSRHLRLPGSDSSSERSNLIKEVWRVDKDEIVSSFATMRFNLIQLFVQGSRNSHVRKMIVDLEAPRFDSGGMFSQDPALSYIRSEKNLNDDQRRAIHKVLTAKDYTLILGMPGTGKTSTMVHAVKALMMRGASVLLTSYTNSAVDNLLIKLKSQGIEFIRIGRQEVVHDDVREHCFSEMEAHSVNDIKDRMERIRVVGATCLGINHPLLANKKFDVCIMDEAGQITLPVSLGPLMLASTFVLVGDHYQLPPLVQSGEARENGMAISLFCRLSEAHPQAISALQCQYRMCAGIMDLSNTLIYGNRLRCGSSDIANAKLELSSGESITLWLKEVLDPNKPVIFITTDQLSTIEAKDQKAANNPVEASIILEITGEIIKRGVPQDEIGIITPYNSQVNLIRRVVGASVEVHTIDKYQGRDKDCILVSFVRSTNNSRGGSSFLLGDWHRINVALTRAKKKLIMVGSLRTLSKVPLLKLLIEKVDEQGGIVHIPDMDIHAKKLLSKCSQLIVK